MMIITIIETNVMLNNKDSTSTNEKQTSTTIATVQSIDVSNAVENSQIPIVVNTDQFDKELNTNRIIETTFESIATKSTVTQSSSNLEKSTDLSQEFSSETTQITTTSSVLDSSSSQSSSESSILPEFSTVQIENLSKSTVFTPKVSFPKKTTQKSNRNMSNAKRLSTIAMAAGLSTSIPPTNAVNATNLGTTKNMELENNNIPNKMSIFTLTALLGCIYGLAFILALIWIIWLYMKRKAMISFRKEHMHSSHRDACSISSMS
jgi:hypothetical protein